jgi:hypothetical protein
MAELASLVLDLDFLCLVKRTIGGALTIFTARRKRNQEFGRVKVQCLRRENRYSNRG